MASPAENSEMEDSSRRGRPSSSERRRRLVQCSEDNCDPAVAPVPHAACQEAHYPYEIICLIEGYSRNNGPGEQFATGSSTLVKGNMKVVVDTGNPSEKDKLLRALRERGHVTPDEIDYVVCTHGHSDHVGNLNLFPDATFIVSYDVSKKDRYIVHHFNHGMAYRIDDGVEVIPTPGHTNHDVSVIVNDTRHGVVAITGDLFEKKDDLEREDLWSQFTENKELQRKNREKILWIADFIVPGHGKMFRNTKK